MRLGGLFVVCEKAVRAIDHPRIAEYRAPFILGALREDVWFLNSPHVGSGGGARGLVVEHFSLNHFYSPGLPGGLVPFVTRGPRATANAYFHRAVRDYTRGERAHAFVTLGRIAHLVCDMSCPVHAQRVVHETDPFEWWVDSHQDELMALPLPAWPPDATRACDVIEGMSRFTQPYRADRTNHFLGRVMKSLGRRTSLTREEAETQAHALIPMAASYTVSLLRLFLCQIGELDALTAKNACSPARTAS